MSLFLCQYHSGLVLTVLLFTLNSGIVVPPAIFLLFKIGLDNWALLYHVKIKIFHCPRRTALKLL